MPTSIDEFHVDMNMVVTEETDNNGKKTKKLTFTLSDDITANKPKGGSGKKGDKTSTLVVEKGKERYLNVKLSDEWEWSFADPPLKVVDGDARDYIVQPGANKKNLRILCKPSNGDPVKGQDDKLDFIVILKQREGRDVRIDIDPITENPPPEIGPGGKKDDPGIAPNANPLPIA